MTQPIQTPVQPDQRFVIETLVEENRQMNENRLYLLALVRQMGAEHAESQDRWAAERESLLSRIAQLQEANG